MSDASGNAQSSQPSGVTGQQFLQAVRDNFAILSAATAVFGVGLATIFLAAYLSVFDWHLLWFVQYTDILTFGVIALGVVSGSILFIDAAVQSALNFFKLDPKGKRIIVVFLSILAAALLGLELWISIRSGQGYFHIAFGALVAALAVIVAVRIVAHFRVGVLPNVTQITYVLIMIVMAALYGGQWLGYSVLESNKLTDIKLKDTTVNGAKLIIVMSRHTIFLKDKDVHIVPTADIIQFHRTVPPFE
jgi:hypothetical protein